MVRVHVINMRYSLQPPREWNETYASCSTIVQVLTDLRPATTFRVSVAAFSDSGVSRALTTLPTAVDGVRRAFTFRTSVVPSPDLDRARENGRTSFAPPFVTTPYNVTATGCAVPARRGLYGVNITWLQGVCATVPKDPCLNTSFVTVCVCDCTLSHARPCLPSILAIPCCVHPLCAFTAGSWLPLVFPGRHSQWLTTPARLPFLCGRGRTPP